MTTAEIKSQIARKLDQLPPDLLNTVSDFISSLLTEKQSNISEDNGAEKDPLIGMIDGSPNLATNAEDILREEIRSGSGWSWRQ